MERPVKQKEKEDRVLYSSAMEGCMTKFASHQSIATVAWSARDNKASENSLNIAKGGMAFRQKM